MKKDDPCASAAKTVHRGSRIVELDALRGFAALAVAFYHYTVRFYEIYGNQGIHLPKASLGFYGVHLFFIISGFVICMTLDKTKRAMDFVVARFSRLFPVYWFCMVLTFLAVAIFGLPGREVAWTDAVVNLSMIHRWFGVKDVDGVYWTLLIELSFYCLMFLAFLGKQIKKIEKAAVFWLCFVILAHQAQKFLGIELSDNLKSLLLLEYAPLFAAGIFFYKLRMEGDASYRHWGILFCFISQCIIRDRILTVCVVACLFGLFYLFVYGKLFFLNNRYLAFLGAISYSFYLVHQNLGYIFIRFLLNREVPQLLLLILPLFMTVTLAALITYCVEKPALRSIRDWYFLRSKG